jgi:hypothetical protein
MSSASLRDPEGKKFSDQLTIHDGDDSADMFLNTS